MIGEYIPESELLPQVCKLTSSQAEHYQAFFNIKSGAFLTQWKKIGEKKDMFFCTATLVGKQELLTAAHCYPPITQRIIDNFVTDDKENPGKKIGVRFMTVLSGTLTATCGTNTSHPESREFKIENGWPHPYYTLPTHTGKEHESVQSTPYDITLLKTTEPFSFQPVEIAKDYIESISLLRLKSMCKMMGYGDDNSKQNGILHGVRAYQLDHRDYLITSQSTFNSATHGDSGGAFICDGKKNQPVLVGVLSVSDVPYNPNLWLGYARASFTTSVSMGSVRRWIDYVMQDVPVTQMHCGERKATCSGNYPILNDFTAQYEVKRETSGLIEELQGCINAYSPFYPRSYFKGYLEIISKSKVIQASIVQELDDGMAQRPEIRANFLELKRKIINHQQTDLTEIFISKPYTYPLNQFATGGVRLQNSLLKSYIEPEKIACVREGVANDNTRHFFFDHAREHYQEYLNKEVQKYMSF